MVFLGEGLIASFFFWVSLACSQKKNYIIFYADSIKLTASPGCVGSDAQGGGNIYYFFFSALFFFKKKNS